MVERASSKTLVLSYTVDEVVGAPFVGYRLASSPRRRASVAPGEAAMLRLRQPWIVQEQGSLAISVPVFVADPPLRDVYHWSSTELWQDASSAWRGLCDRWVPGRTPKLEPETGEQAAVLRAEDLELVVWARGLAIGGAERSASILAFVLGSFSEESFDEHLQMLHRLHAFHEVLGEPLTQRYFPSYYQMHNNVSVAETARTNDATGRC